MGSVPAPGICIHITLVFVYLLLEHTGKQNTCLHKEFKLVLAKSSDFFSLSMLNEQRDVHNQTLSQNTHTYLPQNRF